MNKNKQLLDSSKTNNCGMTEQNHLNSVSIENASLQRGLHGQSNPRLALTYRLAWYYM